MKALVLTEYNRFKIKEVTIPEITENEVLVKVKAVGICGSDVHGMDGSTGRRKPPIIIKHEASGVIEVVGSAVKGWNTGDRVTFDSTIYPLDDWYTIQGKYNLSDNRMVMGVSCEDYRRDGAFAEYIAIPQHILYKIPENVTFEQAAMVEPVAVALHALNLSPVSLNSTALINGSGMITLFLIQLLKLARYKEIIVFDKDDLKLEMALKFGASLILNNQKQNVEQEVKRITSAKGVDIGFEVVGVTEVLSSVINSVRKGGNVILVGNVSKTVDFPLQAVVTKQITVQGSCAICGEYPAVLDLIANKKLDVDSMISAVAPLDEGPGWFHRLYNGEKGLMKIILKP